MTAGALTLVAVFAVLLAIVLGPIAHRLLLARQADRRRRRHRLNVTLTELQLQHLTHLALAQLIYEARRSLGDLNQRR